MSNVFAKCIAKITISGDSSYYHMDATVYYRTGMSPDFLIRWRWYFDYLAARLKVAYPRRNVVLYTGPQGDIKLGKEWHEYRRNVMLATCRKTLSQLEKESIIPDLFGFGKSEHYAEVDKWTAKKEALEADTYPIPDFPEYMNRMKEFLQQSNKT